MASHDGSAGENANAAPGRGAHRVVVVGGGFGGLEVARRLADVDGVDITVLDKRNFHLFQPLLYQVATGALSPGDVAAPLREALRRRKNVTVLLGDVVDVDPGAGEIALGDEAATRIRYDTLVVATGLVTNYFGNPAWEAMAPGLKSIEDATEVRSRLLHSFEAAEAAKDAAERRALLTFVVVGAGPTGVEMAGAIAEIAADTMPVEFRRIAGEKARVVLLDAGPRVLPTFVESLSAAAARDLAAMGVEVRTSTLVREVDPGGVVVETQGTEGPRRERIDARVVVWAAGVRAGPLLERVAAKCGAALSRQGTVEVADDCSIAGFPNLFVIGDAASFAHGTEHPLPGVAQVAIQQGRYVASLARARLAGSATKPFRYVDKGSMATIGRARAVADLGFLRLTGALAWLAWLFVHLLFLVGYENRVLVLTQWAWYYVWRRRSARLIVIPRR